MHWDEVLGETCLGAYLYDAPFLGLTPLIPRFVTLIGNYYVCHCLMLTLDTVWYKQLQHILKTDATRTIPCYINRNMWVERQGAPLDHTFETK